ncbi:MAG: hypothetical protein IPP91_01085 [Betaproteobacteria bacterium]|nr:hypothetical protein [Betaproteobacteria bacterium]
MGNISGAANVTTTGVSSTLTVQALPTLTKAFSAVNLGLGQATTLTFTVTNTAGGAVTTWDLVHGHAAGRPHDRQPAGAGDQRAVRHAGVHGGDGTQPFTAASIA